MIEPTDAQIEESRERLGIPANWEWYVCVNQCGDIVWCPPGTGDLPVAPLCSASCATEYLKGLS